MKTNNLVSRRKWLMLISGFLLVGGLVAEHALGIGMVADLMLVSGALVAGSDIAVRAWHALLGRLVSIELLVTVAAAGALVIGEYVEAAAVTFLFLLGAYLETRTMRRTRQALEALLHTAPERAFLVKGKEIEEVDAHAVPIGSIVRVRTGSRIPVDGVVVDGHSAVDEATITGEALPAEKGPGATVYAGTLNRAGVLDVRATGVGAGTALARIIRRVEEAQEAQVPVQRFIERFARWYTPAMMGLSGFTFLVTLDVHMALTLLVIACPGALVIATPVAIAAGIGQAARRGMLIKGGAHLETVGRISALVLDKTGTITEGRPRITNLLAFDPPARIDAACSPAGREPSPEQRVLCWAALAEADAGHPLGQPIVSEALALGKLPADRRSETAPGRGVRADWQGHEIVVGKEDWMHTLGITVPTEATRAVSKLHDEGKTGVLVAVDGAVRGAIGMADAMCDAAPALIGRLPEVGIERVVMATGDDARVARVVARRAGITEVHARQLPEDKLALIRALQQEGHVVAFAGDGINDAPALAAADVGIAMGAGGADLAVESADVALMRDDLSMIPEAIRLSRKTLRIIRQNLFVAVATVAVLLAGVFAGSVNMTGGMLVHQGSLLLVVFNSLRLLAARMAKPGAASYPACSKWRSTPTYTADSRPARRAPHRRPLPLHNANR